MNKLLIGLDYDGTVVHHAFPEVGEFQEDAVRVLKRITDAGHKLILWTCREDTKHGWHLSDAVNKLMDAGIPLRSVNENHPDDYYFDFPTRKLNCDLFLDDRVVGGFPGWRVVELYFERLGLLEASS